MLPPESADMYYPLMEDNIPCERGYPKDVEYLPGEDIECWSLAALLEQFENAAGLAKEYGTWFAYDNGKSHCTKHYDNPLDAAFDMICWLKENKKI